ncbi:MAG: hypothetical protein HQL70_01475 [Magnetococcales bacterium]|nr:hypothetical protein [Magnetococcales bacterium]
MIMRIIIILVILYAIVSFVLWKRGIQIGLTAKGRTALFRGMLIAIRLFLRRFGL